MKQPTEDIYAKIQQLNLNVKEKLLQQGIVVPVKKTDGTVQVGNYLIKKHKSGYYSVVNFRNDVVVDNINLPQTAAIQANRLALGKWVDDGILSADAGYGHALFDEILHKQLAEKSLKLKNLDKAEMMYTKYAIDKHKKEQHKSAVDRGFEKLMRFR